MRFAALFPGQLSEKAGMGEALAATRPSVARWIAEAGERAGVDLPAVFFGEGRHDLHDDLPAQVGVYAVSVAVLDVLAAEHGLVPAACAGYSLGTYAAFVGAGVLEKRAALEVLLRTGTLLREKAPAGGMGYVIGLSEQDVASELTRLGLGPDEVAVANVNAPRQIVLAGTTSPLLRALDRLAATALKVEALPLGWPMHSAALEPVAAELRAFVDREVRLTWPGRAALYAPMLGRAVRSEEEARAVLAGQIAHPSRWSEVLLAMDAAGESRYAEVGPGDLLAKMHRWTLRRSRVDVLEEPEGLARFAADGAGPSLRPAPGVAADEEVT